ncbi:hypothetical protein Tco_0318614 [Tanacetum coccineum]
MTHKTSTQDNCIKISLHNEVNGLGKQQESMTLLAASTIAISPFICTDSSEAPDSSDGPPSQDPYVATVARWRSRVTARPSSSEFPIAPVTAPPGIRRRSATLIRPGEAIDLM